MVDLQDHLDEIHQLGAEVIGVSNSANVPAMVTRFDLRFPMLMDPGATVCRTYDAFDENLQVVNPSTFVIDKQGIIRARFEEPLEDTVPILDVLRTLNAL